MNSIAMHRLLFTLAVLLLSGYSPAESAENTEGPTALLFAEAPLVQTPESTLPILWALRLPALVTEAREVGVTDVLVREVLDGLRRRGLPADEAALVLREEIDAVDAGESKDNFGAFVNRQLDAGLRGRALAEAIRAEHRAQGKGRPGRGNPRKGDTTGIEGRRP